MIVSEVAFAHVQICQEGSTKLTDLLEFLNRKEYRVNFQFL